MRDKVSIKNYKNLMLDLFDGHRPQQRKTVQVVEYRENDPREHYKTIEIKGE